MKLKAIFIIFNVIVIVSFLFVFFLPVFFLGTDYATVFWGDNWYLAVLFAAVLAILNSYFIYNWKLFTSLEAEDWNAVMDVLENRLYKKNRWNVGNIRLLVNAYMVTGHTDKISSLENHIRSDKPALLRKVALLVGIPHVLSNDGERLELFFSEFRGHGSRRDQRWIEWYTGFALMLQQKSEAAKTTLIPLTDVGKPDLPAVLAAYLLDAFKDQDDAAGAVEDTKKRVRHEFSRSQWEKMMERQKGELHVLILTKLLGEISDWLFGSRDQTAQ